MTDASVLSTVSKDSGRLAGFPMYDFPELREAHAALWRSVARHLVERAGLDGVPDALTFEGHAPDQWPSPRTQRKAHPNLTAVNSEADR